MKTTCGGCQRPVNQVSVEGGELILVDVVPSLGGRPDEPRYVFSDENPEVVQPVKGDASVEAYDVHDCGRPR